MGRLILYPTDTSQWHALVSEAEVATHLMLTEDTESYLVFLLKRFSETSQWVESIVALDFLEAMQKPTRQQMDLLREVGDKSLLFAGLFPGVAARRHVNLDYFTEMGKAAYWTVSEMQSPEMAMLYAQLSEQFNHMQAILQSMRSVHCHSARTGSELIQLNDAPMQ